MPTKLTRKDSKMSRLIDSTDDFEAYRNALAAAVKPDTTRNKRKDSKTSTDILAISGLFGFLVAWAALAIYGAIKIMEKIGWM